MVVASPDTAGPKKDRSGRLGFGLFERHIGRLSRSNRRFFLGADTLDGIDWSNLWTYNEHICIYFSSFGNIYISYIDRYFIIHLDKRVLNICRFVTCFCAPDFTERDGCFSVTSPSWPLSIAGTNPSPMRHKKVKQVIQWNMHKKRGWVKIYCTVCFRRVNIHLTALSTLCYFDLFWCFVYCRTTVLTHCQIAEIQERSQMVLTPNYHCQWLPSCYQWVALPDCSDYHILLYSITVYL